MSLRTCLWTLVCGTALGIAGSASALTVVNDSPSRLNLSSPVAGATNIVDPGAHFEVPSGWGDARHVYLTASSGSGAYDDRWARKCLKVSRTARCPAIACSGVP